MEFFIASATNLEFAVLVCFRVDSMGDFKVEIDSMGDFKVQIDIFF